MSPDRLLGGDECGAGRLAGQWLIYADMVNELLPSLIFQRAGAAVSQRARVGERCAALVVHPANRNKSSERTADELRTRGSAKGG
jgi:hypothetical protein